MPYITYKQYQDNGGKADESTFKYYQVDAEIKLNKFTNNQLKYLTKLPPEIEPLETRMIDILKSSSTSRDASLTSYSNGIESFGYDVSKNSVEATDSKLYSLCKDYLCDYPHLLYRGIKNDWNSNDSE